jgi:7,8-dihydropterin-6-yl-methyl-4-(beta-D-ribofuranosyl)aminobenzene 5'-phosphate synthase
MVREDSFMKVTALIENELDDGHDGLQPEFGLSLYIETEDHRVVFDTGASGAFADNAAALGIDLAAVDLAVLSHQHFDHGGGLERFVEANARAPIYLRNCPVENRFFTALAIVRRPIGLDADLVARTPERFRFVSEDTEIEPGVWVLTNIASAHPRPRGNRRLHVERGGELVPDPFDHELVLVIRESNGIGVFSGCSHSGILNMVDAAANRFPDSPIKAVFGGFHLIGIPGLGTMAASRREVEDIGRMIMDRVDGPVFTGHCTGGKGFRILGSVMGDSLRSFSTGASIEV